MWWKQGGHYPSLLVTAHAVYLVCFCYVRQKVKHSLNLTVFAASWTPPHPLSPNRREKKKSSNLCGKFDVILSPKHRQRINWHEDQPGPWANSGGWLTVYSGLHHLPAFVIVSYYCPYFSSTPLQAVSCSPFFLHQPCSALLCVRPDQSASDWMTDCMSCIKPQTPFPDCVVVTKVHMNQCVVESCM